MPLPPCYGGEDGGLGVLLLPSQNEHKGCSVDLAGVGGWKQSASAVESPRWEVEKVL